MDAPAVLIIGAGGYLGGPIWKELLHQKSHFSRVAILADESKVDKFSEAKASGVEIIVGSFTDPASFKGFNTVLSLLGNHAMKYQPAIIDACIKAGVTDFYPSEYGSDISQGDYLTNRYFRDKHVTRQHLRSTVTLIPSFNYTLIMVGGFVEFALMPFFGTDTENKTFTFYGPSEKAEPLTAVADVARYVVESISLPKSPTQEREFRVPGGLYKWGDFIDEVEKVQGVKYTREFLPRQEALDKARECEGKGDVDGELLFSLKAIMGDPEAQGVPQPWDNAKFGFEPERLGKTLERIFAGRK
ncbi:NAD(P)-binding protein [Amniculicola lignicola CBS 123094]|uniref:NAD(P)-binding protein n=1 Tax=Amniculicola lignicola CBS 123094 TaxID=1392246 RepID=A0A6A5W476_9PLEO|nr:NAD(P)-binding protein [Amniculicola lignicola CBS 123094]